MNQHSIPQRKHSNQTKHEQQKQMFSNTNVLTGISQNAMGTSYRTKQPSHKEYPMAQASEKGRNMQGAHSFISDTPLSTNTHILNAQQNIQYNSNSGLNSTMPLKFTHNGNMEMRQGKQTENVHAYENDAYNTHITPYSQSKKVKESQNRTNSQGSQKNMSSYSRQNPQQTNHSQTPKTTQNYAYANNPNVAKQSSQNSLKSKYNRNPSTSNQVAQQRSSTTGASKSSSSKNLLNKTQQQISSNLIAQVNAQYKGIFHQGRESSANLQKEKVNQTSRNNIKPSNPTVESNVSSNQQQPNHKSTLNEYKQFMEKQKQMLKQLSSNKLALMINALNNTQQEPYAQIQQNKRQSQAQSKMQSPRPVSLPQKQEPQDTQKKEQINYASTKDLQVVTNTPRTQPNYELKAKQEQPKVVLNTDGLTPRTQIQLNHKPQEVEARKEETNNENQEANLNDDSMCFSKKTSLEDYIIGKQIGQGAYAVVRIGLHKPSNKKVAMKIYKKYKLLDPNRRKSVKREIKLMEKMKHPNIIRLYEVIDTSKYVILVMEYVGGGSLHGYLKSKSNRRLDEQDAKRLFRQVLEGIKYCHSRCITHRDIKLENLLLDDQNNIKIIDFGFSTCIPNDKKIKIFCGTPSYMAPEIVQKIEYAGPPADIWALGVLLFTILSGCFPYRGATDKELYKKIMRAEYRLPSEVQNSLSSDAVNLIKKLFIIDAANRPSAKEVLCDPWLNDAPIPKPMRSHSNQPQQPAGDNSIAFKRCNTDVVPDKQEHYNQRYNSQQPQKTLQDQSNPHSAYFGNIQVDLNNSGKGQSHPYSDQQQEQTNRQSQGQYRQYDVALNVYFSGNNPINNNFNIVNNIMQIAPANDKQMLHNAQPLKSPRLEHQISGLDESIIQTIVTKLGYTAEDVKRYVREENSFVSVLYHKLMDEQNMKLHPQRSTGSFTAVSNIQPSFVPSITSSLNQSNISHSQFNNTQPFTSSTKDTNGKPMHGYYGSYHGTSSHLSQTLGNTSLLNNSILSGIARKNDQNPHQRNRDPSLGVQQYDMIFSSDEESMIRSSQLMNSTQQVHQNFNNTQLTNISALLNNSSITGLMGHESDSIITNTMRGANSTQPINFTSHQKRGSIGQDINSLLNPQRRGTLNQQSQPQANNGLLSKNLQFRREFL